MDGIGGVGKVPFEGDFACMFFIFLFSFSVFSLFPEQKSFFGLRNFSLLALVSEFNYRCCVKTT